MANNGAGADDDETSEDASDVYEIRSEAGGSEPEESGEHGSNDDETSVLGDVENPRVERRGRAVGRSLDPVMERGAVRGSTVDLRGSSRQTPPSDYQMALQSHPKVRRDSRWDRSPPLPERIRPFKTNKPPSKRAFIKPPRFEGEDNCLESHLVQFEIIAKHNQWDDLEKADFLKCSLSGEASHMLRDLDEKATYDDVVSQLRQRYGSLEQIESYRMELKHRKRKLGETLSHLLKDIRRLFLLAYPGPQNYMTLITARDAFIDALNDRDLMIKVMEREPSNLDQAFKIAERLELYQRISGGRETEAKSKPASKVRGTTSESDPLLQSIVETQKLVQKQLSVLSESIKKDRSLETKSSDVIKTPASKIKGLCHQCHQPGHYRMQCPEWQKKKETEAAADARTRCVRSRSSSEQRNEDVDLPSFSVRPVQSRQNRRSIDVMNGTSLMPSGIESGNGMQPSLAVEKLMSNSSVDLTSSRPGDRSSNATKLDGDMHVSGPTVSREWVEYIRKYPPPPITSTAQHWVPSVQPEHWVPPVQPEHRVPPGQPEHWVPPVQPERHWVPSVQPEHWVPPVQPEQRVPPVQPEHSVPLAQPALGTLPTKQSMPAWVPSTLSAVPPTQLRIPPAQPLDETSDRQDNEESKKKLNNRLNSDNSKSEAGTNVCTAGNTYYIEIKLGKKRCSGLIDTGSEVILLPKQLADLSQINRSSRKLRAANGTQINIVGEWQTTVAMGPLQVSMNFIVSDQIDEILVGIDWLREHRCLLSFADLTVALQGYCFPLLKEVYNDTCNRSVSQEAATLPAGTRLSLLRAIEAVVDEGPFAPTEQNEQTQVTVEPIEQLVSDIYPDVPEKRTNNMKKVLLDYPELSTGSTVAEKTSKASTNVAPSAFPKRLWSLFVVILLSIISSIGVACRSAPRWPRDDAICLMDEPDCIFTDQVTRDHLKVAARKRKTHYDARVRSRHLAVGRSCLVLLSKGLCKAF